MINLPPTLKVDRDEEAEKGLLEKARGWVTGEDRVEGIHASDLLMPRKGYWRALDPQPISDREVGLFLVGKVLHAFVLSTSGASGETKNKNKSVNLFVTDEGAKYDEELALYYSPDRLQPDGTVAEFKTSRSKYPANRIGDLDIYLQQLLIYMAAEKVKKGEVWVLYTNAKDASDKTSPQFRVYRVEIGEDELTALRLEVRKLRDDLAGAQARKDHRALPLCPAWACSPIQCAWWSRCKPEGRHENPSYLKEKRR